MNLVAKTFAGLEEVLADELRAIDGATNIEITKRGVLFEGDKRVLYRANLECRTALRILLPFHWFKASNEQSFYRKIQDIDWWEVMDTDQTFAIDAQRLPRSELRAERFFDSFFSLAKSVFRVLSRWFSRSYVGFAA